MLTRTIAEQIILEAVHAPSGDNAQPWRFVVSQNKIGVFDVPDPGIYNFKNRGSYIAQGALIENISIIAAHFGFSAEITLCPDPNQASYIAAITFTEKPGLSADLYPYIANRATNRKKYFTTPLQAEEKDKLKNSFLGSNSRVVLIEDKTTKIKVVKALVVNERLILENKIVHDYLFSNIFWTKDEVELRKSGLDAATLELAFPKLFIFKKCKNWVVAKILTQFGLSRAIAADNAKLYMSSSAFGAILIKNQGIVDYLETGRLMQRFWLRATSLEIYLQPVAAVPFLAQRLAAGDKANFSLVEAALIEKASITLKNEFNLNPDETIAMVFRLGKALAPTAVSVRRKPEIVFQS